MSKSQSSPESEPKTSHPLWETLAMIASFILLWFWFGARQTALKANTNLPLEWTLALLISLAVLIVVTVLRMRRFKRALDETREQMKRGPMPFGFTPTQPKPPKK